MKWLNPHKRGKKSPHAAEGEEKARYNAGAQNEASFKLCPLSADVSRKNGDFRKKNMCRLFAILELTEQEGFEPPIPFGITVFKTVALSRSATAPNISV